MDLMTDQPSQEAVNVREVAARTFHHRDPGTGRQQTYRPGDIVPSEVVAVVSRHVLADQPAELAGELGLDPRKHTGVPTAEHLAARRRHFGQAMPYEMSTYARSEVPEVLQDAIPELQALRAQRAAVTSAETRVREERSAIAERNTERLRIHQETHKEFLLYGGEQPEAPELEEVPASDPHVFTEVRRVIAGTEIGILRSRRADLSEALRKKFAPSLKKRDKAHQLLGEAEAELAPYDEARKALERFDGRESDGRSARPDVTINGERVTSPNLVATMQPDSASDLPTPGRETGGRHGFLRGRR